MMIMESRWRPATIFLHWGLSIAVTLQLALSLFMWIPDEGPRHTALQGSLLDIHEWVGLIAAAIVLLHWLWSLRDSIDGSSWRVLFPWDKRGRKRVIADLLELGRRRLPMRDSGEGGLAGFVHGLGLLCITGMALTGSIIFPLAESKGFQWHATATLLDVHAFISAFVWIYWFAHVGIALLHWLAGHEIISPIFNPRHSDD